MLALLVANFGTACAELAGVAAGGELFGVPRTVSVPLAAVLVTALVLRGTFHHVEHFLMAIAALFVTYVAAGLMVGPDWQQAATGLLVPTTPFDRDAWVVVVAIVGTTLAPWGLSFVQSYAVDKQLHLSELRYARIDVAAGALLTGVIGAFIVISCAATLNRQGIVIDDAADAARGLRPLAGGFAATLFGLGFVGAALLAAAVVPLSTAYSVCEGLGRPADVDAGPREEPLFYGVFAAVFVVAAVVVLIPGAPLIDILVGTQALNAVLLLVILPFLMRLGRDRELMGAHASGRVARTAALLAFGLVALSIAALAWLSL
jgi:Mn2+/Fe2+ NRAMP family transporter